ncbi:MAG: rubrerythrin [Chloroflexi bacterium]|nr:rubrerythrin [Chloroflexota bacterium]
MPDLKGTKTEENLKAAFAGESQAHRRYTAWARKADEEGFPEVANLFRSVAEGETAHALGHFKHLGGIQSTKENLGGAVQGETYEEEEMYPQFARVAREEGFWEIADWFEAIARAEKAHATRFQKALGELG